MQHELSLDVPELINDCILRIVDTSSYNTYVPFTCSTVSVTCPGFNYSTEFTNLNKMFSLNLNACDLQLQTVNCGTAFSALPDGIYIIKYSVSPNDYVFVEYNHLRMTQFLKKYNQALCDLSLETCSPTKELKEKLTELHMIKTYAEAAKAQVEFCHDASKGITLLAYANKLLSRFTCTNC